MYPYICLFGLKIPSYGLCMTVAVFLGAFLAITKARKNGISTEDMLILSAVIIGSFLFGGGILYIVVSYSPLELYRYIINFDFSFIANVGLVFYGGLIGGVTGGLVCSNTLKVEIGKLEVCIIPYIPLGHAIGRVGCLLAGCCHGFRYDGIFAIKGAMMTSHTYFPIQAVEAILNVVIAVFLLLYTKKEHRKYDVLTCYLMMYSVVRFILELFRGDEIRGGFLNFSTSQWISMLIFLFCIVGTIYRIKKKNK